MENQTKNHTQKPVIQALLVEPCFLLILLLAFISQAESKQDRVPFQPNITHALMGLEAEKIRQLRHFSRATADPGWAAQHVAHPSALQNLSEQEKEELGWIATRFSRQGIATIKPNPSSYFVCKDYVSDYLATPPAFQDRFVLTLRGQRVSEQTINCQVFQLNRLTLSDVSSETLLEPED